VRKKNVTKKRQQLGETAAVPETKKTAVVLENGILKNLSLHREMAASSYLLPPLEQHVLLPREASQGTLGYKNHPTYDYLTCTQARSWSYRHVRLS